MIRIRTGSRLHFGLFSIPWAHPTAWLNHEAQATLPRRQFGGVGMMVDHPGIEMTVTQAPMWSATGPLAARALEFAQIYCNSSGVKEAFRLNIESAIPEHVGLGSGTQLGLAVARAMVEITGGQPWGDLSRDNLWLAMNFGRGRRSAIGAHGFTAGGLIVEGGKISDMAISPLLVRQDFPEDWHALLVTPRGLQGAHGLRESGAFADLATRDRDDRTTEALCRLVLLAMLPALGDEDLATFGEALYDFNRRVGEMFQPVQGGIYAHPRIEEIVKMLRRAGVKGVGQTSWGPTVFAIVPSHEIGTVRDWLIRKGIANEEMVVTLPCNHGAVVNA
jgi:beta-RFAP synthase